GRSTVRWSVVRAHRIRRDGCGGHAERRSTRVSRLGMSDRLYVGVDGGGTRARAVVIDDAGRELARTIGPSGLVDPRDPAGAAAVIADLARSAVEQAGGGRAASLGCGLAGAGRPQEREAVRVALALEHVADEILVVGDAEAAMIDAFPDGEGVLLV